jgi:hypothetical protein
MAYLHKKYEYQDCSLSIMSVENKLAAFLNESRNWDLYTKKRGIVIRSASCHVLSVITKSSGRSIIAARVFDNSYC